MVIRLDVRYRRPSTAIFTWSSTASNHVLSRQLWISVPTSDYMPGYVVFSGSRYATTYCPAEPPMAALDSVVPIFDNIKGLDGGFPS